MPDEPPILEPDFTDPLSIGQDRMVAALQALPWFTTRRVPVEMERRGDIVQTVTNQLNRLGAAACVLEPVTGTMDEPDEFPLLMTVGYVLEVVENVTINRSTDAPAEGEEAPIRVTALQIATRALAGLHGKPTGPLNPKHELGLWRASRDTFRRLPHKTLSIYQITFRAGISLADIQ